MLCHNQPMTVWPTLYTIGAAQGMILAIALWRKPSNRRSNRLLAVWLICLALDLAIKALYLNNPETLLQPAYILVQFFPFLYGAFFYLYIRTLTRKQPLRWLDLIHSSGFVFMTLANIRWIIDPWQNGPTAFGYYELSLYLYSVSYVVAGLIRLHRYRVLLDEQASDIDGIDLNWLRVMAWCQIGVWSVAVSQWLLPIPGYNLWYIYGAVTVFMIVMGYLGLTQQNVDAVQAIEGPDPAAEQEADEKLIEADQRLQTMMREQKLYLTPGLNIAELARRCGYPEYLISLVINRVHGQTFRAYINHLRINAATDMLRDPDNPRSILEIAYDCGFTSKSTFNLAFRKQLDMTPSAFRQAQAPEVSST